MHSKKVSSLSSLTFKKINRILPQSSTDKFVWNEILKLLFFFFILNQFPLSTTYLNLSFDEGRDVVLILKDGERLQQVVFQPLPVLRDLFPGGSWRRRYRTHQYH